MKISINRILTISIFFLVIYSSFISMLNYRLNLYGLGFFASVIKDIVYSIIVLGLFVTLSKVNKVKINLLNVTIILLIVYYFFHFYSYVPSEDSLDGLRYQVVFPILCLLMIFCSTNGTYRFRLEHFFFLILTSAVICSLIGVVEYFFNDTIRFMYGVPKDSMDHVRLAVGYRLISTFRNPINFGAFLCFALVSLIYFRCNEKVSRLMFFSLMLLFLFNVYFTLSRMALLAFFIVMFFYCIYCFKRKPIYTLAFIFLLILFSSFFILFFFDFSLLGDKFSRFQSLLSLDTYSKNIRVIHWVDAVNNMNSWVYILMGLGAGVSKPGDGLGFNIENSYVTIFVEMGVIGILIYTIILILFYFNLVNMSISSNRLALFLFMLVFLIMSTTNDMIRNFPFSMYFWMIIYFSYNELLSFNYQWKE